MRGQLAQIRMCSSSSSSPPSHIDSSGHVCMVDVGDKSVTQRFARARGTIELTPPAYLLVKETQRSAKGSVLAVAQLAGIMAAKQTAYLIPLCHSLPLAHVSVNFELHEEKCAVTVEAGVKCEGKTGVEMEALTAASVALLTIYDMTKSLSHAHTISEIKLVEKFGGRSGHFVDAN